MSNSTVEVSGHLKQFKPIIERLRPNIYLKCDHIQYPVVSPSADRDFFRNDWACLAFRGFLRCAELNHHQGIESFCTIGTGIGLDALAAIEALKPQRVMLTDVIHRVVAVALRNVKKNIKHGFEIDIQEDHCSLFESPALTRNKFDVIYENLPVLPDTLVRAQAEAYLSASFSAINRSNVPRLFVRNLLSSHYEFLRQARAFLQPHGVVICNIGVRIPIAIIQAMFVELGYHAEPLVYDVKRQTEAESNVPAYQEWARQESLELSFYRQEVIRAFANLPGYNPVSGLAATMGSPAIADVLKRHRIGVDEAAEATMKGQSVAHEVVCMLGRPIT